jgi:biotin carboxyl carrier protein
MPRTSKENIAALHQAKERLQAGGGAERAAKQHSEGKLTVRERLKALLGRDSFQEIGLFAQHRATLFGIADKPLPADGVVTGSAVNVSPGQAVRKDDPLAVLEAMKMQVPIGAPLDGAVEDVQVAPGDAVLPGQVLCSLKWTCLVVIRLTQASGCGPGWDRPSSFVVCQAQEAPRS